MRATLLPAPARRGRGAHATDQLRFADVQRGHPLHDRVLTDVPSEQTSNQTLWWASDYQCFRDNSVGYDDSFSVSIKRSEASPKASAWSTLSWAHPFNERPKHNRRFRFTAMVKTVDCTGPVRLAHYSSIENLGDMYYGGR